MPETINESALITLSQMRSLTARTAANIGDVAEILTLLGVFYGECNTEAATAAKIVTADAFVKTAGAKIIVKFTAANTADNATLNVNNTGAALITYQGSAIGKSQLSTSKIRLFVYDGTNYEFVGDINTTHNTFTGASANANGAKGLVPQPLAGEQGKVLFGNAHWGSLPILQGATDETAGTAGLVPAPIAGQENYYLTGTGSWGIPSGGSGGGSNYLQVTKTSVTAPKEVKISLPKSTRFQYAPPSVLFFVAGSTNIIETACDFDNGDADDFTYTEKYVYFDGAMKLSTEFAVTQEEPTALGDGYLYVGETINVGEYKTIENIEAGVGKAEGIALVASGGGSGTWARFEENSTAIILVNGAAYDCSSNLLAANWSALSASEKEEAFLAADGGNSIPLSLSLPHDITVSTPTTLDNGYISVSDEIDVSDYEAVESVDVGGIQTTGIALVTSGGGSGTWANFAENCSVILINSSNEAYDFDGNKLANDWTTLTDSEKETAFADATGDSPLSIMDDLETFSFAIYSPYPDTPVCTVYEAQALSTFTALLYMPDNETTPTCTITAVPQDQLITPSGLISLVDYDTINSAVITAYTSGNAKIRYAVTADGSTYYVYDSTEEEWTAVAATAAGVIANGMTDADVAAIPTAAWTEFTSATDAVGFAYALSMTNTQETCYVDTLTLTVNMKGTWRAAVYGTEYTYAYPNNVSMVVNLLADGNWKINYDAG